MAKRKTTKKVETKKVNATNSLVTVEQLAYYHEKDEALTDGKLALKQNITDNNLETTSKTIVGAINEVRGTASKAYHYKGSVATVEDLPSTGQQEGDVWNVQDTGINYAWTGTEWDALGGLVDLSEYRKADDQDVIDAGKVDTSTTVNGHALTGNVTVTKGDVSLGNVDNTSDLNKPISTATQAALDEKQHVLIAGTNITITPGEEGDTISAEGGTTTVSFNAITGSPYDNTNLSTALNSKQATLIGTQTTGQNIKTINGSTILGTGDLTIEAGVSGVKGDAETTYRTGNVNITKANINLGNVANYAQTSTPTSGSNLYFTAGGAYTSLATKQNTLVNGTYVTVNQSTNVVDVTNLATNADIDAIFE